MSLFTQCLAQPYRRVSVECETIQHHLGVFWRASCFVRFGHMACGDDFMEARDLGREPGPPKLRWNRGRYRIAAHVSQVSAWWSLQYLTDRADARATPSSGSQNDLAMLDNGNRWLADMPHKPLGSAEIITHAVAVQAAGQQ
jgi:hypothetical protein